MRRGYKLHSWVIIVHLNYNLNTTSYGPIYCFHGTQVKISSQRLAIDGGSRNNQYKEDNKGMQRDLFRVVRRDGLARCWAVLFAANCMALMVTALIVEGAGGPGGPGWPGWLEGLRAVLVLTALLFGLVLVLRAATVSALLIDGAQADGRVTEVLRGLAGVGVTSYGFVHDNCRIQGSMFMARGFEPGQSIGVSYDPSRPEQSVIRDVFL